jgi:predicted transposase/invertase (TIGR01784 family)
MTKAIKELKLFSLDDHRREAYEQRLKAMRDYESSMAAEFQKGEQLGLHEGEQIGIKKGKEEGLKEGKIEDVLNALKIGLDVETIHKITGVAKEEIRKLQKQAKEQ